MATGLSQTTVRNIILGALERLDPTQMARNDGRTRLDNVKSKKNKYFGTLTREHIEFLTDQQTLQNWVGKSLECRALLFHRKYP